MATLQSLLATVISPSQESNIPATAVYTFKALQSGDVLAQADDATLHKFMVRVSALLKAKAPVTKWFGAYLAHLAVDTNWKVLKSHGGTWANLLLHLLEINEQAVVKEAVIRALRTIFAKTHGKQEFTRDITTPRLPQYLKLLFKHARISETTVTVSANGNSQKKEAEPTQDFIELGYDDNSSDEEEESKDKQNTSQVQTNIKDQSRLLPVIVPAINTVLRLQSTTFRPFTKSYISLISTLISLSYTDPSAISASLLSEVCAGYALLHHAAPKDTEALTWRLGVKHIIGQIHATLTEVTASIVDEDFEVPDSTGQTATFTASNGTTTQVDAPALKLKSLTGATNGIPNVQTFAQAADKISALFTLLSVSLRTPTKGSVKLPLGSLILLADRVLSLSAYTSAKSVGGVGEGPRRAAFLAFLSSIHFTVFDSLLLRLIPLTQSMLLCHIDTLMHHTEVHVQPAAGPSSDKIVANRRLQLKALQFGTSLLRLQGTIPKSGSAPVASMVSAALALTTPYMDLSADGLADAVPSPHLFVVTPTQAQIALVTRFLETVILTVPELSLPVRASIDRWLIVSAASAKQKTRGVTATNSVVGNRQMQLWDNAIATSAIVPGKASKYSILPMGARLVVSSKVIEALIKPRLPPSTNVMQTIVASATLKTRKNSHDDGLEEEQVSKKRRLSRTNSPVEEPAKTLFGQPQEKGDDRDSDVEMIESPELNTEEEVEGGFLKDDKLSSTTTTDSHDISSGLPEDLPRASPETTNISEPVRKEGRVRRQTKTQLSERLKQNREETQASEEPAIEVRAVSDEAQQANRAVPQLSEVVQISDSEDEDATPEEQTNGRRRATRKSSKESTPAPIRTRRTRAETAAVNRVEVDDGDNDDDDDEEPLVDGEIEIPDIQVDDDSDDE